MLVLGSCTGEREVRPTSGATSADEEPTPVDTPTCDSCRGGPGTYRTAIEAFEFTAGFDPTAESWRPALGLYSEMLLRTLMTFRHVGGMAGTVPVPDLAREAPKVSADGLRYTFTLKRGVKFGPPLDRDVTSHDVEYAFERINSASLASPFRWAYAGLIEGMSGRARRVEPVSGIDTPDGRTIVFHLRRPVADLPYLLAMPATAPVPREVARCFTKPGRYGRFLIATGPYMIGGEDTLDTSSCHTMKPIRGFDPKRQLTLVRNPDYDPSTDSPEDRENNFDGFHVEVDPDTDHIYRSIQAGDLDGSWGPVAPRPLHGMYDPSSDRGFHSDLDGETRFINMNLLVPPFDDVAVRRAVNYAIDKAALQQAWGGPSHGDIATHIFPPTLLDLGGAELDPYATPDHAGDISLAKEEMAKSRYDSDHDGVCDALVCRNVLVLIPSPPPEINLLPEISEDLRSIGLQLKYREMNIDDCGPFVQTVRNLIPISICSIPEALAMSPEAFAMQFDTRGIRCNGEVNTSELGMTERQARKCGVEEAYSSANRPPSADAEIARCGTPTGPDQTSCWIRLDEDLMTRYVPWAAFLWSRSTTLTAPTVIHYEFDQFSGTISFSHIAIENGIDPEQFL